MQIKQSKQNGNFIVVATQVNLITSVPAFIQNSPIYFEHRTRLEIRDSKGCIRYHFYC